MKEVCLEWVVVNQETHHVSEYAHLLPKERPEAFCPECGQNIIFKLGQKKLHHAAHHEGAICAATQPETALHINAKYHLKAILRSCNELHIQQSCVGWSASGYHYPCSHQNNQNITYIRDWDQVEDEWKFGNFRLDIALLKNREVIGAIEVLVTHPTEEGKIEFLNRNGIAWLEIKVNPDFYTPSTAWDENSALNPEKYNAFILPSWQCPSCSSNEKEAQKRIEQAKRNQEEFERKKAFAQQFKALQARVIDYYYSSGKKYRSVYVIQAKVQDNQYLYIELQEVGVKRQSIAKENPPISELSYARIKKALELEIQKKKSPNTLIDDSRQWDTKLERFHPRKYLDEDRYPYNYEFVNGKWEKHFTKNYWSNFPAGNYFQPTEKKPLITNQDDVEHLFQEEELTCERCGKKTTDWATKKPATKTCICRDCAYNP